MRLCCVYSHVHCLDTPSRSFLWRQCVRVFDRLSDEFSGPVNVVESLRHRRAQVIQWHRELTAQLTSKGEWNK